MSIDGSSWKQSPTSITTGPPTQSPVDPRLPASAGGTPVSGSLPSASSSTSTSASQAIIGDDLVPAGKPHAQTMLPPPPRTRRGSAPIGPAPTPRMASLARDAANFVLHVSLLVPFQLEDAAPGTEVVTLASVPADSEDILPSIDDMVTSLKEGSRRSDPVVVILDDQGRPTGATQSEISLNEERPHAEDPEPPAPRTRMLRTARHDDDEEELENASRAAAVRPRRGSYPVQSPTTGRAKHQYEGELPEIEEPHEAGDASRLGPLPDIGLSQRDMNLNIRRGSSGMTLWSSTVEVADPVAAQSRNPSIFPGLAPSSSQYVKRHATVTLAPSSAASSSVSSSVTPYASSQALTTTLPPTVSETLSSVSAVVQAHDPAVSYPQDDNSTPSGIDSPLYPASTSSQTAAHAAPFSSSSSTISSSSVTTTGTATAILAALSVASQPAYLTTVPAGDASTALTVVTTTITAPALAPSSTSQPPASATGRMSPVLLCEGKYYRSNRRVLLGTLTSQCHVLQDVEGNLGCFFVFPDVAVRASGDYRLRFDLFDLASAVAFGPQKALATVISNEFRVYSPQNFPGMAASTAYTQCFSRQGIKMIRRYDLK
ncbi:hypothetical protein HDU96_006493 [Phlyctochytrium bullatum]|nr:hypothetical protein HDU96_006493 [Phlyctochytrium bullatum]